MSLIQVGSQENPQEPLCQIQGPDFYIPAKHGRWKVKSQVTIVFPGQGKSRKSLIERDSGANQGDQSPSTTGLASAPIPSMETVTSSPATSAPIPAGVPVKI